MRRWFYGLSLLEGWLPVTLLALGAASIIFLLWRLAPQLGLEP